MCLNAVRQGFEKLPCLMSVYRRQTATYTHDLATKNHGPVTFCVRLATDNPFARGPSGNIKFILLIKLSAGVVGD